MKERHPIRTAVLHHLLPGSATRRLAARLVRPLLRWSASFRDHHRLWTAVQQTVNRPSTRATGTTWFGARMDCDLTDMIAQRIFYTGVWEPDISVLIARHLAPGDTFVDVGANIGYFALLAAHVVGPAGRVYAIEPWPATAARLRRNMALNRLANVEAIDRAVAATRGTLALYAGGEGNSGEVSALGADTGRPQHIVQAAPLQELVPMPALAQATAIKIDIEGGEPAVLRELLGLADQLSPRLMIVAEVTPLALQQYGWPLPELVRDFAARGFAAQQVHNDYGFGPDWWRFDPNKPPRLLPLDLAKIERFDLVLRRSA